MVKWIGVLGSMILEELMGLEEKNHDLLNTCYHSNQMQVYCDVSEP